MHHYLCHSLFSIVLTIFGVISSSLAAAEDLEAFGKIPVAERKEYLSRFLTLIERTDVAQSDALYGAQQEGMSLVYAIFSFGSPAEQQDALKSVVLLVRNLPRTGQLSERSLFARYIGAIELRSPVFTRVRQRFLSLPFSVDGIALPVSGPVRERRVFPTAAGDAINVLSEVELQFSYLLSTILRLAVERPLPAAHPLDISRRQYVKELFTFLLLDKLRFYWYETPAWHWQGPFLNMRERVTAKLKPTQTRLLSPPWFQAIVDHELHLFAIAADIQAAVQFDRSIEIEEQDRAMLQDIQNNVLKMLSERVQPGFPDGGGFLIDVGLWSSNPSYAYSGCTLITPLPLAPCPQGVTATDSSHAHRWPWWINSFIRSLPWDSKERIRLTALQRRLARQFAERVLYFDSLGRPLARNFMDGNDGWYRLREFPSHPWGHGPSSMTGTMRYGAWAFLAPIEPKIAAAYQRLCNIFVSKNPEDIQFRTLYYGSASIKPEMAGLGEKDLYGSDSLFALTCTIGMRLGLYKFTPTN